jgi:hypothetical protein
MYHEATILVTTHCNRQCPECCYRIPRHETLPAAHYAWAYFAQAATFMRGLSRLYVTGGEPTLHPQFDRILREFDALFEPDVLELITNGYDLPRHMAACGQFGCIWVTDFGDPAARAAIAAVHAWDPGRLRVLPSSHTPLTGRGSGQACIRNRIAGYAGGRLYPCCEMPGIPGAASMVLTRDWRETLAHVPLACDRCCFSPAADVLVEAVA